MRIEDEKTNSLLSRAAKLKSEDLISALASIFVIGGTDSAESKKKAKQLVDNVPWDRLTLGVNVRQEEVQGKVAEILSEYHAHMQIKKVEPSEKSFLAFCAEDTIPIRQSLDSKKSQKLTSLDTLASLLSIGNDLLEGFKNSPVTAAAFDVTEDPMKLLVGYNDMEGKLTLKNGLSPLENIQQRVQFLQKARKEYKSTPSAELAKKLAADFVEYIGGVKNLSDIAEENSKHRVVVNNVAHLLMDDNLPLWSLQAKEANILVLCTQDVVKGNAKLHAEQNITKYFQQKQILQFYKSKKTEEKVTLPVIEKVTLYFKNDFDKIEKKPGYIVVETKVKKNTTPQRELFWINEAGMMYKISPQNEKSEAWSVKELLKACRINSDAMSKGKSGDEFIAARQVAVKGAMMPLVSAKEMAGAIESIDCGISMLACGKCSGTISALGTLSFFGSHFQKYTDSGVADPLIIFGHACDAVSKDTSLPLTESDREGLAYHYAYAQQLAAKDYAAERAEEQEKKQNMKKHKAKEGSKEFIPPKGDGSQPKKSKEKRQERQQKKSQIKVDTTPATLDTSKLSGSTDKEASTKKKLKHFSKFRTPPGSPVSMFPISTGIPPSASVPAVVKPPTSFTK